VQTASTDGKAAWLSFLTATEANLGNRKQARNGCFVKQLRKTASLAFK
jgi:hypothetical protein